jgi:hypothetical protein
MRVRIQDGMPIDDDMVAALEAFSDTKHVEARQEIYLNQCPSDALAVHHLIHVPRVRGDLMHRPFTFHFCERVAERFAGCAKFLSRFRQPCDQLFSVFK